MTDEEFDKLYYSKRATDIFIESIFKPEKYVALNEYLNRKHEEWKAMMIERNKNASRSNHGAVALQPQ
jgi:hypothetical protein